MLNKTEFCKIIAELQEIIDISNKIDELYNNSKNSILRDFGNGSLLVAHEDTVVKLLEHIFNDQENEWLSWWCWETDFGNKEKDYRASYGDGTPIILETAEQLYDFLITEMENQK